tara:strand:+ start:964 stop:1743 length:780 start_codon:yes stop_codon:yes gene_type:complete
MIFLHRTNTDRWMIDISSGKSIPVASFDYDAATEPIVFRGLLFYKDLINKCWKDKKTFYYIDTGYFGNYKNSANQSGQKRYHRLVKNHVQHITYTSGMPDNRLKKTGVKISEPSKNGKHILLVAPSKKPCMFYDIDLQQWKDDTVKALKQHTDRPIRIRDKASRTKRISKPIHEEFKNCHAVVTYQSIAAVEALMGGIPAFTAEATAADPFTHTDLSQIESPRYADRDEIYDWACYLSYCQFTIREIKTGKAFKILNNE